MEANKQPHALGDEMREGSSQGWFWWKSGYRSLDEWVKMKGENILPTLLKKLPPGK